MMRIIAVLLLTFLVSSCSVRLMDKHILECCTETSGLALSEDRNNLYTIEDSGNGPFVYKISTDGHCLERWDYLRFSNIDWEEMVNDSDTYFIGDIGNNLRNRDTLTIYNQTMTVPSDDLLKTQFICDHPEAPFDFEAMFFANDSLYLITKNHGEKYTYLFRVEIDFEFHKITPIDSARIRGQITGAGFDAENKLLIMTGYRWYIPFVIVNKNATPAKVLRKPFKRRTFWLNPALQTEAVVIVSPDEIYVSSEGNQLRRPGLFKLKLSTRKNRPQ